MFRGVSKYDDTRSVARGGWRGMWWRLCCPCYRFKGLGGYFETDVDCRIVQILGSLVMIFIDW